MNYVQNYLLNKLPEKVRNNIEVIENGCWLYTKNINGTGYGRVSISTGGNKKRVVAHKYTYELLKGEYKKGLVLDHNYCNHRNCCNPTHLSPIPQRQNVHRGKAVLLKKKVKPPVDNFSLSDLLNGIPQVC